MQPDNSDGPSSLTPPQTSQTTETDPLNTQQPIINVPQETTNVEPVKNNKLRKILIGAALFIAICLIAFLFVMFQKHLVKTDNILNNVSNGTTATGNKNAGPNVRAEIITPKKILFEEGKGHKLFEFDLATQQLSPFYPELLNTSGVWPVSVSPTEEKIGFISPTSKHYEAEKLKDYKSEYAIVNVAEKTHQIIDLQAVVKKIESNPLVVAQVVGWSNDGTKIVIKLFNSSVFETSLDNLGTENYSFVEYDLESKETKKIFTKNSVLLSFVAYYPAKKQFVYSQGVKDAGLQINRVDLNSLSETEIATVGWDGGDATTLPADAWGGSVPLNNKFVYFNNLYNVYHSPDSRSIFWVFSTEKEGQQAEIKANEAGQFENPKISYSGEYFYIEFEKEFRVYSIDGSVVFSGKLPLNINDYTIPIQNIFLRDNNTWLFSVDGTKWDSLDLKSKVVKNLFNKNVGDYTTPVLSY